MPEVNEVTVKPAIKFYFDFLSPYAYLAHHRLTKLAEEYGYTLDYRPIDLALAKQLVGNTGPSSREIPIKHKYLREDLARWARLYDIPFSPPAGYGSDRLNAGAFFALDRNAAAFYVHAAWPLIWGEGGAMNDDALLTNVAKQMRWDPDEFLAYVSGAEVASRLQISTENATQSGVFGVPMMCIDNYMWWGNDRLHFLEDYLKGSFR